MYRILGFCIFLFGSFSAFANPPIRLMYNSAQAKDAYTLCRFIYLKEALRSAQRYWPISELELFEDSRTGFRALLRIYKAQGKTQVAVAFRGVYDFSAALSAIALGYTQSASEPYANLLRRVEELILEVGPHRIQVEITGHSMGGALSQLFSYQLAKLNPELRSLKNITWNAPGGMGLIENNEGYDPQIASRIDATHIRIKSDLATHIGKYLPGESYALNVATAGHFITFFEPYVMKNEPVEISRGEAPLRLSLRDGSITRKILIAASQATTSLIFKGRQLCRYLLRDCRF